MAYGTKFKEEKIRGVKVDIFVSSRGEFNAEINNQLVEAKTLEDLVAKLNKASKSKYSIEFWRWMEDKGLMRGTITGQHASTGNMLVKFDGQKGVEQESKWGRNHRYLALDEAQRAEYTALRIALDAAEKAVDAYEGAHCFDPQDQITDEADA